MNTLVKLKEVLVLQCNDGVINNSGYLGKLPSAEEVHKLYEAGTHTIHKSKFKDSKIVCFPNDGLLVKFGKDVSKSEAYTLLTLQRMLGDDGNFLAPRVYAWHTNTSTRESFLFYNYFPGVTLEKHWHEVSEKDKEEIAMDIKIFLVRMKKLRQENHETWIGTVDKRPINDRSFYPPSNRFADSRRVFSSAEEFQEMVQKGMGKKEGQTTADKLAINYLDENPELMKLCLTHGNLHPSNIIIGMVSSGSKSPTTWKLQGLVDWDQCAWMEGYWELGKAMNLKSLLPDWKKLLYDCILTTDSRITEEITNAFKLIVLQDAHGFAELEAH